MTAKRSRGCVSPLKQAFCEGRWSGYGESDGRFTSRWKLDRRGNAELKNLSYHAWRTACKSTTGSNAIKSFYQQSRLRTGSVRHARLNTQRKILEALWLIWLRQRPFDPEKFNPSTPTPLAEPRPQ